MSAIDTFMDDMPMDVNCNDLFDHIDDLLDFPNYYYEDDHFEIAGAVDGNGAMPADTQRASGGTSSAAPLPPVAAPLPCNPEECAEVIANAGDKVLQFDELDIAADLEWVSNFMDDTTDETFAAALNFTAPNNREETILRTCSPISVLCQPNKGGDGGGGAATSSSSSSSSFSYSSGSGGGDVHHFTSRPPNPIMSAVPARARSKRPRPSTFSARPHVIVLPPSEPECFGESTPPAAERKIKIKIRNPNPTAVFTGGEENTGPTPVRKCMHCEITKTPQWRAGPMGPKTLCNACGVRYKSGRLFPEYRPAASPTFVPAIHSNSHKKVVEMRIQRPTPGMPSPDSCDLLNYIRRKD